MIKFEEGTTFWEVTKGDVVLCYLEKLESLWEIVSTQPAMSELLGSEHLEIQNKLHELNKTRGSAPIVEFIKITAGELALPPLFWETAICVETEGGGPVDDLDYIEPTTAFLPLVLIGAECHVAPLGVTVKDGTGNICLATQCGDYVLGPDSMLILVYVHGAKKWMEVSRGVKLHCGRGQKGIGL